MAESSCKECKQSLGKEDADPAAKGEASNNKHLRLSLKNKSNPIPREGFSFLTSAEVEEAKQAVTIKNTKKCTDWSVRMFGLWLIQRNQRCASGDECQEDILLTTDHELLCKWLCIFASELRKSRPVRSSETGGVLLPWKWNSSSAYLLYYSY